MIRRLRETGGTSFPDNQAVTEAVELALAVVRYVIWDQYQGKPTDAEAEAVAAEITRAEAWAQPTESEVVTFLQRLVNGVPFAGEVPAEQVILAFVSAANLLASCHRENEKWWNYLDRAEAAIEAS